MNMKKNQQLEKIILQQPGEEYLTIRKIKFLHLTTRIVREAFGQFISIPIGGNAGWPDLLIFMGPPNTFFVEFRGEIEAGLPSQIWKKGIRSFFFDNSLKIFDR